MPRLCGSSPAITVSVVAAFRGLNDRDTDRLAIFAEHVDPGSPLPWQWLIVEGGLDFRYGDARKRLLGYARDALI